MTVTNPKFEDDMTGWSDGDFVEARPYRPGPIARLRTFVRRLRRAWRAEFGEPQEQWVRIVMAYPEVPSSMQGGGDKTLSFHALVSYTASGVVYKGHYDTVQVEASPSPIPYIDGLTPAATHEYGRPDIQTHTYS